MKPGTPFVAFSLHPSDDALHVSTLDGSRVAKNQVQESTFSDLEAFNLRGLDESAMIIGKYVLGLLYMSHPDKFKLYPEFDHQDRGRAISEGNCADEQTAVV